MENLVNMKMPSGWYAIAEVSLLSTKKPNLLRRFGLDLAVWRNSKGEWIIHSDRCPHRSASLSRGRIEKNCIVCPFHGFAFSENGHCSFVPETGGEASGIKTRTFKTAHQNGLLWLAIGEPKQEIPWFPDIDDSFTMSKFQKVWNTHFTRCVENQLDYAHLPFVHKRTIGSDFNPKIKATFETSPSGLKTFLGESGEGPAYFELRFPNIWALYISDRMREFIAFVPIDDSHTLILMRHYQRFTRLPILRQIISSLATPLNKYILSEDHRVVMTQKPLNSLDADSEMLIRSDTAVRAFRNWMRETD